MSGADLGGIPKDYRYWREWHARGFCVACGGMRNAYPYHCDDCYPALANRISQRPMTSSIPPKSEPEQKMSAYDPDLRRSTEWARPSSIPHPEDQVRVVTFNHTVTPIKMAYPPPDPSLSPDLLKSHETESLLGVDREVAATPLINSKNHGRASISLEMWLEVFREADIHSPASLAAIAAIETLCADAGRFEWIASHAWNGKPPVGLDRLRGVVDRELAVDKWSEAK